MLVDPAETDSLEILEAQKNFDLRDPKLFAPLPAAMASGSEDDEDEEDEESEDDSEDASKDSDKDSDESEDEDDEDDDESTRKLIKDLREENKKRRIENRQNKRELDRLKAENARLKKRTPAKKTAAEEDDDEEDADPAKLTPREEAAEVRVALADVLVDLDLDKRYRRIISALIDPDEIEIKVSDSGKVTVEGLKEAVEELLEDYPEWRKTKDDDDEEDKPRKTGSSQNRRRRGSDNGLDKATLAKKYPALAGR